MIIYYNDYCLHLKKIQSYNHIAILLTCFYYKIPCLIMYVSRKKSLKLPLTWNPGAQGIKPFALLWYILFAVKTNNCNLLRAQTPSCSRSRSIWTDYGNKRCLVSHIRAVRAPKCKGQYPGWKIADYFRNSNTIFGIWQKSNFFLSLFCLRTFFL